MIYTFDGFELDGERLVLRHGERLIKLEAQVSKLLLVLVQNAGNLVSKDELVEQVWDGRDVADNVITVSMARLRKALNDKRGERELVVTVYGKGYRFARPVVTDAASALVERGALRVQDERPPFVGRERPLSRLRRAAAEARAGRGRVCVLLGEPGIGKTSVVEALTRELGPTMRVAWGFCREAGDTPPLWPWRQLLAEMSDNSGSGARAEAAELRALCSELGRMEHLRGAGAVLAGSGRHESFALILRAFTRAAKHSPWLLVLDDLHRADAASLELLSHLTEQVARTRILVVGTARSTHQGRAPRTDTQLPYVLGHRNCERLVLERLSEAQVASYVGALLEDHDGRAAQAIYQKSEGNPFFMAELLRQLRDSDLPDPATLTVSDAALSLVRQRVAKLDVAARGVLSAAAVIGRTFELPLLSAVTGLGPSALISSLDGAIAAEVLVPAPNSLTAFAFGHELLRAVLYDALSPAEQRRWHLVVAERLEQRLLWGQAVPSSELAYHFHAALPQSDLRKTVKYCREAAAEAASVYAHRDVVRYCEHALEALLLMERPSRRLRISLLYLCSIYTRGEDSPAFARNNYELIRQAKEFGDGCMLVRGASMLHWHPGLQPLAGADPALRTALELLPQGSDGFRAVALACLACSAPTCFDQRASGALMDEALQLIERCGSRAARYAVLLAQLYLRGGPEQPQAAPTLANAEQLAADNPKRLPILPVDLSFYRAIAALCAGDQDGAQRAASRAAGHAQQLRHRELLWHGQRMLLVARINRGELHAPLRELWQLHAQAAQQQIWGSAVFAAFDRAAVAGELMAEGARLRLAEEAHAALQFMPSDPPGIWALKVRALASAGFHDEARSSLRRVAVEQLPQLPRDSQYLGTLGQLTRAVLALGELEYARALEPLLARYDRHYAVQQAFWCDGSLLQLRGMVCSALGRPREARDWLERALPHNERAGFVVRALETRLTLAELWAGEDHGRAEQLLREVQLHAGRLGIARLADLAAAQLPQIKAS